MKIFLTSLLFYIPIAIANEQPLPENAKIETIIGLKGTFFKDENTFKVSSPRNDVPVSVDGIKLPPFMGLTSWVAFNSKESAQSMIMGDLVLFEDEVNPVMSAAFDAGIDVTALHNHFFYDNPKVYFMHIAGEGSAEKLAKAVRACFDKVKEIRSAKKTPATSFGGKKLPAKNSITPNVIEPILGAGEAKDGMYKIVIGRTVSMECGCKVGKNMGVNTWAAFMGSDDNALVDGDFAVLENELQGVLKSLRSSGINIVAIHQHMTNEKPRMLFLHYWGKDTAQNLAMAVKKALDTQKLKAEEVHVKKKEIQVKKQKAQA